MHRVKFALPTFRQANGSWHKAHLILNEKKIIVPPIIAGNPNKWLKKSRSCSSRKIWLYLTMSNFDFNLTTYNIKRALKTNWNVYQEKQGDQSLKGLTWQPFSMRISTQKWFELSFQISCRPTHRKWTTALSLISYVLQLSSAESVNRNMADLIKIEVPWIKIYVVVW